jgi:hypothetical protein
VTTVDVTNDATRLDLQDGKDYIVRMPSTPVTARPGVWIIGGRNITIVGGEIFKDTPITSSEDASDAYGLYLKGQTGTVHVEGMWIHGRGVGQALVLDEGNGATVDVEHCRLESLHPVGYVHTDAIQTWRGPYRLLLSYVTIRTAGVGLQTMPNQFGRVDLGSWDYRHVNIVQLTRSTYALWKATNAVGWWPEHHQDFWVKNLGYLAWPTTRDWEPGTALVTGERLHQGRRRTGDFAPLGSVGIGYGRAGTTPAGGRPPG